MATTQPDGIPSPSGDAADAVAERLAARLAGGEPERLGGSRSDAERDLDELVAVAAALRQAPPRGAPPAFRAALARELAAREADRAARPAVAVWPRAAMRPRRALAWAAALALAVAGAGLAWAAAARWSGGAPPGRPMPARPAATALGGAPAGAPTAVARAVTPGGKTGTGRHGAGRSGALAGAPDPGARPSDGARRPAATAAAQAPGSPFARPGAAPADASPANGAPSVASGAAGAPPPEAASGPSAGPPAAQATAPPGSSNRRPADRPRPPATHAPPTAEPTATSDPTATAPPPTSPGTPPGEPSPVASPMPSSTAPPSPWPTLAPGSAALAGAVRIDDGAGGAALAGATVRLHVVGDAFPPPGCAPDVAPPVAASATTDAEGRFAFPGIGPGRYVVSAVADCVDGAFWNGLGAADVVAGACDAVVIPLADGQTAGSANVAVPVAAAARCATPEHGP